MQEHFGIKDKTQGVLNQDGTQYPEPKTDRPQIKTKNTQSIYPECLELVTGLEPATCALRMRCTTNCATQAN